MARKYHYEWAAYTDNLCWGRQLIARDIDRGYVVWRAAMANKGAYVIVRKRVYDKENNYGMGLSSRGGALR